MTTINRNKLARKRRSRGAVAVEFAICFPILFTLLFACYELARANMVQHACESAAYEAARTGIVPGVTEESIRDSAAFVLNSVGVRVFDVNVTPNVIRTDTEKVTVDIAIPFRSNVNIPRAFIQDPTFRGSCTLTRETF